MAYARGVLAGRPGDLPSSLSRHSASPHPALGAFVHSYWGLARDLTSLGGFTVTPDQFVEVVFCAMPSWKNPGVSLAALAAEAGYADQPHLTRQFKRYAGVTPRQFQAQMARLRAWQEAEDARPREVAIVQDPPEPGR